MKIKLRVKESKVIAESKELKNKLHIPINFNVFDKMFEYLLNTKPYKPYNQQITVKRTISNGKSGTVTKRSQSPS